ncbi:hypothetical protein HOLleu_41062 [Holothuria leucospilota]|uniref:Uncharacterized protein n=1 Tax=Holothuria leucospilota TaxID=206669 RepID=A0A9Q0YFC7_HOLLE|nr:hypothetical protein HOLleu_41062 [Holothuria leucospilota]
MRTENFEFYSRRPYGTPSPLSGLQAAVTLRREVWTPVAQIILALPPASVGITHFIVPTSPMPTTCLPKKLENFATGKTTAS